MKWIKQQWEQSVDYFNEIQKNPPITLVFLTTALLVLAVCFWV